jgi:hypothetical protein
MTFVALAEVSPIALGGNPTIDNHSRNADEPTARLESTILTTVFR